MKSLSKLMVILLFVSSGSLFASDYRYDRSYDRCSPEPSYYKKARTHHYKKYHYEEYHHEPKVVVTKKKYRYHKSYGHGHHHQHHHYKPYPIISYDSHYGWTIIF